MSPSSGRQVKVKKTTIWARSARRAVTFPTMRQPPAPGDVFGHVVDGAEAAADVRPAHPAWAPAMVVTDVPSLDDVLDGTVDVAGTFRDKPKKRTKSRKSKATASRPTASRPALSPQPALGRGVGPDPSAEVAPASETAVWPGLAAAPAHQDAPDQYGSTDRYDAPEQYGAFAPREAFEPREMLEPSPEPSTAPSAAPSWPEPTRASDQGAAPVDALFGTDRSAAPLFDVGPDADAGPVFGAAREADSVFGAVADVGPAPDPLPAEETDGPGRRERRPASPSMSPQRVGAVVGESGRRAAELARRRPDGVFARRSTLVAVAAVALVAGLGAGAGVDALSAGEPTATVTAASVSPAACSTAQVAWARAAAAQVRMDLAAPETLRTGFVGARTAMTGQTPPAPIAADWTLVQDYVTTMADAVADVEADAVETAVVAALATLDTDAMTASSQRITDYLGANCDL
jgi:hypothetical protein